MTESMRYWWLATSLAIVAISLWESLVCWPAMIGCHQPWVTSFPDWLRLFFLLLTGPVSPLFIVVAMSGPSGPDWMTALGCSVLFGAPCAYLVLRGRRRIGALILGAMLWLFAGHLFCIGIWV